MKQLAASLSLAMLLGALVGCRGSASPTAPDGPPSPPLRPITYSLSGLVFTETPAGRIPVEGARVSERNSGQSITTGVDGRYSLQGLHGTSVVSVSAWGIEPLTRAITLNGDTELDIAVVELRSFTLSGVVFERTEAGTAPIEGVHVYCDACGSPVGHTSAYTDAHGQYSFSYTYAGVITLLISKDGYGDPPGVPPSRVQRWLQREVAIGGDTRFDIELVPR